MKTPEDIRHFCRQELRQPLEQFERTRKRRSSQVLFYLGIIVVPTILLVIIMREQPMIVVPCLIVGLATLVFLIWSTLRGHKKQFKKQVMAPLVEFALPGAKYEPDKHIKRKQVIASDLFPRAANAAVKGGDRVIGMLEGRPIQVGQIRITQGSGSGKNNNSILFWGVFANCDLGIQLPGKTLLLPNISAKLPGGILGKLIAGLIPKHEGEKVTFDDPTFDKTFEVWSTDPEGALAFFSDALRDDLGAWRQRLDERLKASNQQGFGGARIALVEGHAYVAMPTNRNCFDPPLFSSLLDPERLTGYVEDLALPLGIVEILARHGCLRPREGGQAQF